MYAPDLRQSLLALIASKYKLAALRVYTAGRLQGYCGMKLVPF